MQQYFIEQPLNLGEWIQPNQEQAHHIFRVMRMREGTLVRLVDTNHQAFFAKIENEGCRLVEEDPQSRELPFSLTLAVALIRKEKFELILQKATELGVSHIVPFVAQYSVVHMARDKSKRYEKILLEAAEQCLRNQIPVLEETKTTKDLLQFQSELNLFAYEKEALQGKPLVEALPSSLTNVTFVVGPEGGFSETEGDDLLRMGYQPVSLGKRILRAETACLYGLSVLGAWGERK